MAQDRLHVVPHGDGWAVKCEGKNDAESTHATQKEAIDSARELASQREADLVVHRSDGTFRKVYTVVGEEEMSNRGNGGEAVNDGRGRRLATSDLLSVGTRISWGAVLAGTAVALSTIILLGMLATATGITLQNRMSDRSYFIGAMICSIVTMLAALFLGGFIVSRLTTGEDKTEAVAYGVVLWATLFVALAALAATGANVGYNALAMRNETSAALPNNVFEGMRTPLTDEQVAELRAKFEKATPNVSPATAAWWTFASILLSLGAAIGGSIVGAGPTLYLRQIRARRAPPAGTAPAPATQAQLQTTGR